MDSEMDLNTNQSSVLRGEVAASITYPMSCLTGKAEGLAWGDAQSDEEKQRFELLERQLVDAVIEAYEHVVEEGLPANVAISNLLLWVAQECPRMKLSEPV